MSGMSIKERLRSKRVDESLSDESHVNIRDGLEKRRERIEGKVIKNLHRKGYVSDHRFYDCYDEDVCHLDGFDSREKLKRDIERIIDFELSVLKDVYNSPIKRWDFYTIVDNYVDGVMYKSRDYNCSVFSRSARKSYELITYLYKNDELDGCGFGYLEYRDYLNVDGGD